MEATINRKRSLRKAPQITIQAVIIADRFLPSTSEGGWESDPLAPLTLTHPVPLLPLANTPLIDYLLENLVQNGISEVHILASHCYENIYKHLNEVRMATGKSWMNSKEIKVLVHRITNAERGISGAMKDVLDKNIVGENFLLIPSDHICSLFNLRELFENHLARVAKDPTIKMTLVMMRDESTLVEVHHSVTTKKVNALPKDITGEQGNQPETPVMSGSGIFGPMQGFHFEQLAEIDEHYHLEECAPLDRLTVAYEPKKNQIIRLFQLWNDADTLPPSLPITFTGAPLRVRSDLVDTGIYICQSSVLGVFQRPLFLNSIAQGTSSLVRHIVDNVEVEGEFVAVDLADPRAFVRPVGSCVRAYLHANVTVSERQFFPMTREADFAESQTSYTVAPYSPSVYIHRDGTKVLSRGLGPHVTIGRKSCIEANVQISHSSLGSNVTVGEGSSLKGVVIFNNVSIGKNCLLTDCIICSHARIADGWSIQSHSIVGEGVRLDTQSLGGKTVLPRGSRIALPQSLEKMREKQRQQDGSSSSAAGAAVAAPAAAATRPAGCFSFVTLKSMDNSRLEKRLPLEYLFTNDEGPLGDEEEEEEEAAANDFDTFYCAIRDEMEESVQSESRRAHAMVGLTQTMISCGKSKVDLAKACIQSLIEIISKKYEGKPAKEAAKAFGVVMRALTRPIFRELVPKTKEQLKKHVVTPEELAVLSGFCMGLSCSDGECVLRPKASTVLSSIYAGDEELFAKQGFSVVSYEAIMAFDDTLRMKQAGQGEIDFVDRVMIGGWSCAQKYVDDLRALSQPKKKKAEK